MTTEILFTDQPIVAPMITTWPNREIGAMLEFQGIVREQEGGEKLTGLFYEAHERMARKRLEAHFAELAAQFPVTAVLFIHRTGWVPVGDASLLVRVLSSHRAEALAFLSEAIIRLKQDVPIWKLLHPPVSPPS